jgi:predicted permease
MSAAFEARLDAARRSGSEAVAALWARTILDLFRTAGAEWLRVAASPRGWVEDLRVSARSLARSPSFSLIAGGTIALGIGANTAVFSVVRAVLMEPLPVEHAEELHRLWSNSRQSDQARYFISPSNFLRLRDEATTFDVGAWLPSEGTILLADGTPLRVENLATTASLLHVLGVEPALGRLFGDEETRAGGNAPVLISWDMWQNHFGADPDVLARTLDFPGGGSAPILGVLPEGIDVVLPAADVFGVFQNLEQHPAADARWLNAVIRIAPGATPVAARAELAAFAQTFEEANPAVNAGWAYETAPLEDELLGDARSALTILLTASGLVLLIACANVGNLILGRAEERERSVALRAALGAGRGRILRLLAAESAILVTVGGALGLLLAGLGLDLLVGLGAAQVPRLDEVQLDAKVLAFTGVVTLVAGVGFGLIPAARLAGLQLAGVLRDGSRGSGVSRGRERVRSGFVVAQLTLSVVLVATAGLLVRDFVGVVRSDPGFRAANLVTAELTLNGPGYADLDAVDRLYSQWVDRVSRLPGVDLATLATSVPFGPNWDYTVPMRTLGSQETDPNALPRALNRMVDASFFEALAVPVLAGRTFTTQDDLSSEGVVILNEAAARLYFPGESAMDRQFTEVAGPFGPLGETRKDDVRVIGIVRDMKYGGLDAEPEPTLYFPFRQAPFRRMTLVARTEADPGAIVAGMRRELAGLDGTLAVSRVGTVAEMVYRSVARERLSSALLGLFALLALSLASVGIYGVLSHAVRQRMNEIGIRRALGADAAGVARLVLRRTLRLTAVGLVLGLGCALLAGRALASQLSSIGPRDPLVMGGVVAVLGIVALGASIAPLVRAIAIDPAQALRQD